MDFLSRLSLKAKILTLVFVPVVGLAWITVHDARESLGLFKETEQIKRLSNLAVKTSALLHEMQKERGMSAGFLGSGGNKFADSLEQQRALTSTRLEDIKGYLETNRDNTSQDTQQFIREKLSKLQSLDDLRQSVSAQSISVKQQVADYTAINTDLISIIAELPHVSSLGAVNNLASAYVNFIQSKERAGIERAVLSGTFAADAFQPGMHSRFLQLVSEQRTFLKAFEALASEAQMTDFRAMQAEAIFDQTQAMRNIATAKATEGGFAVDPTQWFALQTEKINRLKAFEDRLSDDLVTMSENTEAQAWSKLLTELATAAFSVLVGLAFAWAAGRSILQQLGCEPALLEIFTEDIASGRLDSEVSGLKKKPSGVLAAMYTMRDKLQDQIERDKRHELDNLRYRQALSILDTNVMIADKDNNIVFINPSLDRFLRNSQETFRSDLPNFDVDTVVGSNMDVFHKHPEHQRKMVAALTETTEVLVDIGGANMRLKASPVLDPEGKRLGTAVEWFDRYQEVVIQSEMHGIMQSALAGDLSQRIRLDDKKGYFQEMSSNINNLLEVCGNFITEIAIVLEAMAQGDLSRRMDTEYGGAFARLRDNINSTNDKLNDVINGLTKSSNLVLTGSREIAEGNSNLSNRTEIQASNLEQTASSMEEMTARVRQNAENANEANELARGARSQAEQGGEVVNRAVKAMGDITESSNRIAAIISVIDELAFQTNLLALNAAVEAARAGEQGRGFAVVASEVRSLAGRSATAAREIKELIEDSANKVQEGSRFVNASGQTLEEIVTEISKVSDIIAGIAVSSQEQRDGIEQVNRAIAQMDEMTQQNAALVEEAAASSESMGEQAGKLNDMVGFFNSAENVAGNRARAA